MFRRIDWFALLVQVVARLVKGVAWLCVVGLLLMPLWAYLYEATWQEWAFTWTIPFLLVYFAALVNGDKIEDALKRPWLKEKPLDVPKSF